jgi:hypothetical protein
VLRACPARQVVMNSSSAVSLPWARFMPSAACVFLRASCMGAVDREEPLLEVVCNHEDARKQALPQWQARTHARARARAVAAASALPAPDVTLAPAEDCGRSADADWQGRGAGARVHVL